MRISSPFRWRSNLLRAFLTAAAACASLGATDVLVLMDRSHGLWTLQLTPPPAGATSAGIIEVEERGSVVAVLAQPGDRYRITNGVPAVLVFHRGVQGRFAQRFVLVDGQKRTQAFDAAIPKTSPFFLREYKEPGAAVPDVVRVRLAWDPGAPLPGAAALEALQHSVRFDLDVPYLEILADYLPH